MIKVRSFFVLYDTFSILKKKKNHFRPRIIFYYGQFANNFQSLNTLHKIIRRQKKLEEETWD